MSDPIEIEPLVFGDDSFREEEQRRRDEAARRAAAEALEEQRAALQELQRPTVTEPTGPAAEDGRSLQAPAASAPTPAEPEPAGDAPSPIARDLSAPTPRATPARAPADDRAGARSLGSPMSQAGEFADPNAPSDAERRADADIARWDARIQAVRRMRDEARDHRSRAALGQLLTNLVLGAGHALSGAGRSGRSQAPQVRADLAAFDRRAAERLDRRTGEWSDTDRAILQAQQLREERRQSDQQQLFRERQLGLQEQNAARQARVQEAQFALQNARSETQRQTAMRALLREDPRSELSSQARLTYLAEWRSLPERIRANYGANEAEVMASLQGLSAHDIEQRITRLPDINLQAQSSLQHLGGGGGLRTPGGGEMSLEDFRQLYVTETGRAPEAADLVYANPRARREFLEGLGHIPTRRGGDGAAETTQILPGVTTTMDLEPGEARAMRQGFSSAMSRAGSLRRIGDVGRRYGGLTAAIDRDAQAEIVPELALLRGMVATLGQTGTIQAGEVPAINAALPNPADLEQMTFGTFERRLATWRSILEDSIRAQLWTMDVPEEQANAAIQALWRGGGAGSGGGRARAPQETAPPAEPSSGRRVTVTGPDLEGGMRTRTRSLEELVRQGVLTPDGQLTPLARRLHFRIGGP